MAFTFLQGQTLGKYRILEPLGRGGMARVYRGYHQQLDRYVAIKVLRPDLVDDAEFAARFRREARSVAALRHPNIVQVYDFDVQEDVTYMVIELLEGDTLKVWLNVYRAQGERMPLADTVRILLDALAGLAYAHSEGMIHRDIKPGNIMLTRRGQAVITDFGIAQIVGGTQHTVSGALMGTLNYMAPEQGLKGACDARSDIYSLGIVFYEMMTRSIPFDADTPLAILMKHLNDPLPLPREVDPSIPEPFERVVLKSLAKQPEDRYQSAEEMAQALLAAAEQADIEIPTQVAPLAWICADVLSDSVAVISGTARAEILDAQFADGETDTALEDRLALERAATASEDGVTAIHVKSAPGESARTPVEAAPTPLPIRSVRGSPGVMRDDPDLMRGGGDSAAAAQTTSELVMRRPASEFLDRLLSQRVFQVRMRPGVAVLVGIGLAVIGNLAAVWLAGWTGNWAIFEIGWPMEFFLAGLALSFIMYGTATIWLLIPAWILVGNGLVFSYCSLTGNWRHWSFLWPIEPLVVGSAIVITIWLAKKGDLARRISRPLGCGLSATCVLWSLIVVIGAMAVGVLG